MTYEESATRVSRVAGERPLVIYGVGAIADAVEVRAHRG